MPTEVESLLPIAKDSTFGLNRNNPVVGPVPTPKEEELRARDAEGLGLSAEEIPRRNLAQAVRTEHVEGHCAEPGCKVVVGLQPSPTYDGKLACSWHDEERRAKKLERAKATRDKKRPLELDDLPVREITCIEDALALAQWVPIAVIMGDIDTKQAAVIVASIREYRTIEADRTSIARFKALEKQIQELAEGGRVKGSR